MSDELRRRDFIKIISGAAVATVLPSCTRNKPQSLIPYVIPPEEIIPGKSVWYATVCRECPSGCGIYVRVREGRAVKIEGNPDHPINSGAVCSRGQAALQGTYNPDRIQYPMRRKSDGTFERISWDQAINEIVSKLENIKKKNLSENVAFLTQHLTGSLDKLVGEFLNIFGSTYRLRYEPFAYESLKKANELSFNLYQIPEYNFLSSKYILSFGADFLETWLSPVKYAREFSEVRKFDGKSKNRFVYIGPRLSMTAANADEWIRPVNGTEGAFVLGLVYVILSEKLSSGLTQTEIQKLFQMVRDFTPQKVSELTGVEVEKINSIACEFASSQPGLAIGGGAILENENSVSTLCAINLLNYVCGNIEKTINYSTGSSISNLNNYADLVKLIASMNDEKIDALFINEVNPVYSLPPKAGFTEAMEKVPLVVAFSSFMDETTSKATFILPTHTSLESWGDFEPVKGILGLMQPAMQPVFKTTKMFGNVLIELIGKFQNNYPYISKEQPFLEYLKHEWYNHYASSKPDTDFDTWWVERLVNGGEFRENKARQDFRPKFSADIFNTLLKSRKQENANFLLVTYPHIAHYDGRGANKPWLQELPDPITMMTWENVVEINPNDAREMNIKRGDILKVTSQYGEIELPAYDHHGISKGTIAISIGYGHTEYGRYAKQAGVNVIELLPPNPNIYSGGIQWSGIPVTIIKMNRTKQLANVSGSDYSYGRNIIETISISELINPSHSNDEHSDENKLSMYKSHDHPKHRWGMTIDLDKCIGCGACVTSCYAENNIPVVGKKQVELGRELSWIRIERFFEEPTTEILKSDQVITGFLPMMCQQCDNAPCEPVCPVYAAYHTDEGLNGQVYNRCVGTRYCANNCPYKVRRFNWFDYEFPEPLNWQLNPDVTVRSKGVMEKCTFCIQRIVEGKMNARKESRQFQDGDVVTACQQVCPTKAIVFGDLKDPKSKVNKLREENRNRQYKVFEELNTEPSIVYLKRIKS